MIMNATKTNFLNECIDRYNEVKGNWGGVPTQVFVHAFNMYYNTYTKKDERDAMIFVDNLIVNDTVYLKGYKQYIYEQDENNENIYHVIFSNGPQRFKLNDIDTSKQLKSNIIPLS